MKGLIFIPDINGFTNFVRTMPAQLGATIIQDLLNVIISANPLDMEVSEVEGDAILFYKMGEPHQLTELVKAFMQMQRAFNTRYQEYQRRYNLEAPLSLKLIVHFGDIILYDIGGFKKLYGEAIIEAHRLLKNGNKANDYILITEEYMQALQVNMSDVLVPGRAASSKPSVMSYITNVAYHMFPNTKRHLVLQT
jgi:class 3 adenylate cyclase